MENIGSRNVISVITGISMISTGCLIACFFQKNFFGRYRNEVKNVMDEERPDNLG